MSTAAQRKYIKVLMANATIQETIVRVADAINFVAKQVDDPVLYTQKISFRGDSVYIEWERAPDTLHDDLKRIYRK